MNTCSFHPCGRPARGHGLCNGHLLQQHRGQELRKLRQDRSVQDRFEQYVDFNGPINPKTGTRCHIWVGQRNKSGHGRFKIDGKNKVASRASWELYVGPIPDGFEIDHDDNDFGCHIKECVNVEHLRPTLTNQRRKKNNTSGNWGVMWDRNVKRWRVKIMHRGKRFTPSLIGMPATYAGHPPPASAPQEAIDARGKLRAHLGLPE